MDKITNPVTGRKVSIYGATGKQILNTYSHSIQNGGDTKPHMGVKRSRNHRITQACKRCKH